ncbi:hypothetical protein WG66_008045 [Moniliophthora roreri]|nr:hypothetical protein WG66_008045 [Moniliophthora roreri]
MCPLETIQLSSLNSAYSNLSSPSLFHPFMNHFNPPTTLNTHTHGLFRLYENGTRPKFALHGKRAHMDDHNAGIIAITLSM